MKGRRRRSKKSKKSEDGSHSQPIPDEFSIDQLLATREQDVTFSQPHETESVSEDECLEEVQPESPPEVKHHEFSPGNFPMTVFDEILHSQHVIRCVPMLKQWEWIAFQYNHDAILSSTKIFFSLIQQLILNPCDEIGHVILQCIRELPKKSIPYRDWFYFVKEGIHSSIQSAVYLLALSFDTFYFKDEEEEREAPIEISLLHAASMLCPVISEHPAYGAALKALGAILVRSDRFDDFAISRISSFIVSAAGDVPVRNIALFTSLWPFSGVGTTIMYRAGLGICCHLAYDAKGDLSIGDLITAIKCIKRICDRDMESDMYLPSVILGLAEKVVIAGLKLELINEEIMQEIILSLKFSVSGTLNDQFLQPALIKEQIHVTRTHIESVCQAFLSKSVR